HEILFARPPANFHEGGVMWGSLGGREKFFGCLGELKNLRGFSVFVRSLNRKILKGFRFVLDSFFWLFWGL
ncbi:MAG: hypothetical protein DRJ03_11085, partial [Chloroflexi bacterium]